MEAVQEATASADGAGRIQATPLPNHPQSPTDDTQIRTPSPFPNARYDATLDLFAKMAATPPQRSETLAT